MIMVILLKFEHKTVEILGLHHTLEAEYSDNCPSWGLSIHRHLSLRLTEMLPGKVLFFSSDEFGGSKPVSK